ncbi:hypothetical protein [Paraburkholderia sartisoli]|uniref:Uncharacterized protein n=1 Tax=Paraburkholderia sartisoli TaxID=83784 RepID=A0A1H4H0J8_9BURK|nr:hypothetical protein [Paraburkholderia sartisoli]SEB15349.1 hypothetical protein SAMN05192564_10736 [Paraburkholderia sartisoli]
MFIYDKSLHMTARALALSVTTIRKAQKKNDAREFLVGTPDWQAAMEAFGHDVMTALAGNATNMVAEHDLISRIARQE